MEEPTRLAHLRKDPREEDVLAHLNALLAPVEDKLESNVDAQNAPVVFVIGMARSGTTLAGQLLATAGFGYVSNFIARFWRAPALGATIQRAALNPASVMTSSFESRHGVTEGWFEPHEFGYFWDRWFDLGQPTHRLDAALLARVDASGLRRAVSALQRVDGRPLSFKNNTWCSLQAGWLATLFPRAVFVVCRRDARWIGQSLCIGREERYGSRDVWWSIRPTSYPQLLELPWWEQIAAQVVDFEHEMNDELARVPPERVVEVEYRELCAQPRRFIEETTSRLATLGIEFASVLERVPDGLESRDSQRLSDADWRLLNEAIDRRAQSRQCRVTS